MVQSSIELNCSEKNKKEKYTICHNRHPKQKKKKKKRKNKITTKTAIKIINCFMYLFNKQQQQLRTNTLTNQKIKKKNVSKIFQTCLVEPSSC